MRNLIVILTFLGCLLGFLYLDNLIIEYALDGVVQYKNILTIFLWIVLLSFTGGLMLIFSVLITAFVSLFLPED